MDWRGSAASGRGVLLDFAWKVGVDAMEYEMIQVKVPKCLFPDDVELVFLESEEDKLERDCLLAVVRHPASFRKDNFVCLLVARPKPLNQTGSRRG